jgi:tRNA G18 (ribose-2'-O)-methylase SpoU
MQKSKNEELGRISPEEYQASPKMPIVVILDNIRSMNNIGSAFRTSDAFLVKQIFLTGITAQPPHREINKTALGATDSVPWQYFDNVSDAIELLQKDNYQILAIEQAHESTLLNEFTPKAESKYAVVFGNEVKGVSDEVMQVVDDCLEIPQKGIKQSLNISVRVGIILWDFAQKLKIY